MKLLNKKNQYSERIDLVLEWYEKDGDAFIGEELILGFSAKMAHKILDITDEKDHFVCGGHRLDAKLAAIFQKYVTHKIELDRYEYIIEGIENNKNI